METEQQRSQAPWIVRLELSKYEHDNGDELAVYRCVHACDEGGVPIPPWAIGKLAEIAEEVLGLTPPANSKGGRHTNPQAQSYDRQKQYATVCAVLVAEDEGCKGEKKFERAQQILSMVGINQEKAEGVKSAYYRYKKTFDVKAIRKFWLETGASTIDEYK